MAKLHSSQVPDTDIDMKEVMESPSLQSTIDTPKKKKKSRKSKTHVSPTPDPDANDAASSPQQEDEQSREKKRKRNSESGQQKNKNKNKNPENGTQEGEPINSAEFEQTTAESELPASKKARVFANGFEDASEEAPDTKEEQDEDVDLTKKGKPKKPRGPRIGGKNGQRVGFYTKEEVQLLESFKVNFCNDHELSDHKIFDTMVQHSERAPVIDDANSKLSKEDWPGPEGLKKEEFWAEILSVLPQRDERSLKRFMRRHFQDSTQKPHDWTAEQDEELVSLMTQHPGKFAYVGRMLGRSDDDVTQRWYNQLMHRDKMRRGKWNEEELRSLLDAIQEIWNKVYANEGDVAGKDMYELADKHLTWNHISNSMGNVRTRQQCSDKWRKVRKAVEGMRAAGNPDAQFDPVASVNKPTRWSEGGSVTPKSQAMVMDDEDEEDDVDNTQDQFPAASNGLGISEANPDLPLPSETGSEPGEEFASAVGSPSGNVPSSSSSLENDEASPSKKKRKHAGEEQEAQTKEDKKSRREKRKSNDQLVAAILDASETPDNSQKEKKNKKKSKKSMDAAGAEDEVAATPQHKPKKERRSSDANIPSDDEQPVTESPTKKKKSKKSKQSLEA